MIIFSYGDMRNFSQDVVDNSWEIIFAPLSATIFTHTTLFQRLGETFYLHLLFNSQTQRRFSFLC